MKSFFTSFTFVIAILVGQTPSLAQTVERNTLEPIPQNRITLEARMTENGQPLGSGVEWRIFQAREGDSGEIELLSQSAGGTKSFDITPGEYMVHVAYGHAGAVRKVSVGAGPRTETFVLNAGALKLDAVTGEDTPIPGKFLEFDVYSARTDEDGNRKLIAKGIGKNEVVPFPVGIYHVVSRFGDLNAEVRADLRVQSGKVTAAKLKHRAGLLSLRLVTAPGGEAIADTQWSVLTDAGDIIKESSSITPTLVLSEGQYTAIARNKDASYSKNFIMQAGATATLEVIAEN